MNRTIIEREIAFWVNKNPFYDNYFKKGIVKGLVHLCQVTTQRHPLDDILISDFIAGLALLPIYNKTKNEQQGEEVDLLTKPVFDLLIEHVKSGPYLMSVIDKEISGEATFTINGVTSHISQREMLLHIGRTKAFPLVPKDISAIEKDWIEYKRKQYEVNKSQPIQQPKPEIKPIFKPEAINTIFDLLKDFFSKEHQTELKRILQTGSNANTHLIFLDNGNRLAYAFKLLYESDYITGCQKIELERWIESNFNYMYRGNLKIFAPHYLNDIISKKNNPSKHPILIVNKDKLTGKYLIEKTDLIKKTQ